MCVPPGTAFRDQTICPLSGEETSALSPSSISSSLYKKSSRPEKKTAPRKSPRQSINLPWVYTLCQGSLFRLLPTTILKYLFVWPKHTVVPAKRASWVLRIPCECGKVCSREIGRGATTMNNSPVHNPLLFLWTPTRPATIHLILN